MKSILLKFAALALSLTVHGFVAVEAVKCHRPPPDAKTFAPELELSLIEFSVSTKDQDLAPQPDMSPASSASDAPSASPPDPPRLAPPSPEGLFPPSPPFEPAEAELPQEELRLDPPPTSGSSAASANEDQAAQSAPAPIQARIDAPPKPLHAIRPTYPREARERRQEGDVTLVIVISAEGKVEAVEIGQSSGVDCLDRAALTAARAASFTPAKADGKPTGSVARLTLSFRLKATL